MSRFRFLSVVKPLEEFIPEVEAPSRPIPVHERVFWSTLCLFIFLVCCQIPLFGVDRNFGGDPFYWVRVILASNKGSLMELGISPLITSSMIMQLLVGAKIIDADLSLKEDRDSYDTAQKALGLLMCFGESVGYVFSGAYGRNSLLINCVIVFQMLCAGVLVMLLDDLMSKGYGMAGGISLFISTNICEKIVWTALAPTTIHTDKGTTFEGVLVALVHLLVTRPNKLSALKEAFYRTDAPNCLNLIATIWVFILIIYFQGFRVDLPIKYQRYGGQVGTYPIKLFYTSNIPIILQTALVSNLYFLSQILYNRFQENPIINMLGQWHTIPGTNSRKPVGGLAYYISPPGSFKAFVTQPFHSIVYITFVLSSCAIFSRYWIDISGTGAKDVAKQLRDQGIAIKGYREMSIVKILNQYIPIAASFGGMCIGTLSILADIFGVIGSGTGILLAVTIIFQFYEQIAKENIKNIA